MQFKSLKIEYIAIIFLFLLTGLISAVNAAITCPGTLPSGTVNASYLYHFTGTDGNGNNPWYLNTGSSFPPVLSFLNQAKNSVDLSGTPSTATTYTFTVRHQEPGTDPSCISTLTINPAVSLSPATNTAISPAAVENVLYTSTTALVASGGTTPYTWSSSGLSTWGLGLSSTSGNNITITGTPSTGSAGTRTFTVTVTDNWGSTVTNTYTLTINSGNLCTTSGDGVIDFGTLNAVTNAGGLTESASYVTTKPTIYCMPAGATYAVTAAGANGGTNVGSGYKLTKGTDTITYSINYVTPITGRGATISIGGTSLSTDLNLKAGFAAGALDNAPTGTYNDTITFTIAY
jgi:hypothetical protein